MVFTGYYSKHAGKKKSLDTKPNVADLESKSGKGKGYQYSEMNHV